MQLAVVTKNPIETFLENFDSQTTKVAYEAILEEFWTTIVRQNAQNIDISALVTYKEILKDKGLKSATIHKKLSCIKSFCKFLHQNGMIAHNPAASLKVPKVVTENPTEALTDEEARRMIDTAKDDLDTLILTLLLHLGIRRSELLKIRKKDIYQSGEHTVVRVHGKGSKTRVLPLTDKLITIIANCYNDKSDDDVLITLNASSVHRRIKRAAKRAGIKKRISAHSCRATAITKAIETGCTMSDIAEMAGHASIHTTQLYFRQRNGLKNSPIFKLNY